MQRRSLWLIVGIVGGAAALLGLGLAGLALALGGATGEGAPSGTQVLVAVSIAAQALVLGLPLAVHGWAAWRGRPARPFALRRGGWLLPAWAACIGLGAAVSRLPLAVVLLPVFHVLGMALAPWVVLWLAGRGLRGRAGSWREVVAGLAGGGLFGVLCALVTEGLAVLALILLVAMGVALTPGGMERITALSQRLQDPEWLNSPANLAELAASPVVALSVLVMLAVITPLIEEAFKTLTAGVAARWIRPNPARAFLWGLAGGAGFALAENMLNGALGGAEGWALGAASRMAATLMHCFTGGLVGWGWGQLWTARRPLRLIACYAGAVALHGLWNALSVGAGFLDLCGLFGEERRPSLPWWACWGLLGLLGLLGVAIISALLLAGPRLAAQGQQEQADASLSDPRRPRLGLAGRAITQMPALTRRGLRPLDVPVDVVGETAYEHDRDRDVEGAHIGADDLPLGAKPEASPSQCAAPDEGTHKRQDGEADERYPGDPSGEGDERAHDGQQAGDEGGPVAPAAEPVLGPLQVVFGDHNVAAVSLQQGPAAIEAECIRGDGPHCATERTEGTAQSRACQMVRPLACTSIQPASGIVTSLGMGYWRSRGHDEDYTGPVDSVQNGFQDCHDGLFDRFHLSGFSLRFGFSTIIPSELVLTSA